MVPRNPKNTAAAVRQRLLDASRTTGEPFDLLLTRCGIERLLFRLGRSPWSREFVLKGAMLFATWHEIPMRPTRDVDLLGFGASDVGRIADISEKLQALTVLSMANSRMKDYYDLWVFAERAEIGGAILIAAIQATFARRETPFPDGPPMGLTAEFSEDAEKVRQWRAFVEKVDPDARSPTLEEVVGELREFLGPPLRAASSSRAEFAQLWRGVAFGAAPSDNPGRRRDQSRSRGLRERSRHAALPEDAK